MTCTQFFIIILYFWCFFDMALFSARYIYDFHITHNTQVLFAKIVHKHSPVCTSPITHRVFLLPQILRNLCFSFLLGIIAVPREIENNANAKFYGGNKVHFGRCTSGELSSISLAWDDCKTQEKQGAVLCGMWKWGILRNINNRCNTVFYPRCQKRNEKTLW